jgi:hypothetical protein
MIKKREMEIEAAPFRELRKITVQLRLLQRQQSREIRKMENILKKGGRI